jgi:hypothetical protein
LLSHTERRMLAYFHELTPLLLSINVGKQEINLRYVRDIRGRDMM